MSYDGSIREELAGYFEAKEPGRRECAENWAIAIGLQQVDGLRPSKYLVSVAKKHIEGKITDAKANDLFAGNSWYFRNALVRANYENPLKGIARDFGPLEQFFRNLILGETKELKSRYLLVGLKPAEKDRLKKGCQKRLSENGGQVAVVAEGAAAVDAGEDGRGPRHFPSGHPEAPCQLEGVGPPPPHRSRQGRALGSLLAHELTRIFMDC